MPEDYMKQTYFSPKFQCMLKCDFLTKSEIVLFTNRSIGSVQNFNSKKINNLRLQYIVGLETPEGNICFWTAVFSNCHLIHSDMNQCCFWLPERNNDGASIPSDLC